MQVLAPKYYYDFQCIAAQCPDSCCKDWAVDVDTASAAYYRSLPGSLGDRLREVLLDREGGTIMQILQGRCPMWRQDGLCQIHAALGHDALCQTCRQYPRLRHDYGCFTELGLELSCPAAAQLILHGDSGWVCSDENSKSEESVDPATMDILLRSRAEILNFLGQTTLPLPQAFAVILLHSHSVQAQIDGGDATPLDPQRCLADARRFAGPGDAAALVELFQQLEILTPDWRNLLAQPLRKPRYNRALLIYFIQRYWLQAVSDLELVARVKFMLAACILIGLLAEDELRCAQLFSKEIENDPDNMEAILDGCYCTPALTDSNLLGLLLARS